jgi:hypothetical protein
MNILMEAEDKPTRITARIRSTGNYLSGKKDSTGRIELWEGGRLVGYEKIRPDRKNCWRPGIK